MSKEPWITGRDIPLNGVQMTQYEYEVLTNTWDGPKGAAYNAAFDFCQEFGWLQIKMDDFRVTDLGKHHISIYEKKVLDKH